METRLIMRLKPRGQSDVSQRGLMCVSTNYCSGLHVKLRLV